MRIGLVDIDGKTKYIDGYGDKYIISDNGIVISMYRLSNIHGTLKRVGKPKVLKPSKDKRGYLVVNLYDGNGKPKSAKVHRLVANAFLENKENKRCVCHIDNNPANNNVRNLYWGTDKENQDQAWNDGLHKTEKPVKQFSLSGEFIAEYKSQADASRKSNIPQQNINKCVCGHRKSAGGYIWRG